MKADCGEWGRIINRSLPSELGGFISAHADCSPCCWIIERCGDSPWRWTRCLWWSCVAERAEKGLPATIPECCAPAAIPGAPPTCVSGKSVRERLQKQSQGGTHRPPIRCEWQRGKLTIRIGIAINIHNSQGADGTSPARPPLPVW